MAWSVGKLASRHIRELADSLAYGILASLRGLVARLGAV